jgi:hypothetical protein
MKERATFPQVRIFGKILHIYMTQGNQKTLAMQNGSQNMGGSEELSVDLTILTSNKLRRKVQFLPVY